MLVSLYTDSLLSQHTNVLGATYLYFSTELERESTHCEARPVVIPITLGEFCVFLS